MTAISRTPATVANERIEFKDQDRTSDSFFERYGDHTPRSNAEFIAFGAMTGAGVVTGFNALGAFIVGGLGDGPSVLVPMLLGGAAAGAVIGAGINALRDYPGGPG